MRFREASAAEKMLADKAAGLKIQNLDASLEKIDEDLEKAFHEKVSLLPSLRLEQTRNVCSDTSHGSVHQMICGKGMGSISMTSL